MQQDSIYQFEAYKDVMSYFLSSDGRRGQLSKAAVALQCQPSFLSRVMSSEIHITPDQAFMLSQFWRLENDEREYFQHLVEYERAASPDYKDSIWRKVKELKKNHESLQKRIHKEDFKLSDQQALYFSSWHWTALHFLVCVPEFQNPKKIAARLGLPEELVLSYLQQLQMFGLVKGSKNKWEYNGGQFHLPKNSPFVAFHHQNWRSRAVMDAQNPSNEGIHYTSVLTLSKSDLSRLKELVLQFISESEKIAKPSEPEEVVTLVCDLFKA